MPITAWTCGVCGTQKAPLDHYATTDCGLKVHPSFAAAVLRRNVSHYGRGLRAVEVSDCLGCPRALGLGMTDYAVDPTKHKASLSGTAWHEEVEKATWWGALWPNQYNGTPDKPPVCVDGLVVEQVVHGTIDGVQLVGKIDCLRPARRLIEDWKGKQDAKAALKWGLDDYIAQLGLYAELVEQDLKWRPESGIIWLHDHKALLPTPVPLWPLHDVLDYHPKKGDKSVRQLMHGAAMIRLGEAKWDAMPMDGESMQMGAGSLCHFCDFRQTCKGF